MPLPSTMTPIATTTLTTGAATITFSSIPQGYTDLMFVTSGASQPAGGGSVKLQFNGDAGNNYSYIYMFGSGSGSGSSGAFANVSGCLVNRHNTTDGSGWTSIMNYSNTTTYKSLISRGGGNNIAITLGGMWRSTSAITYISCSMESGPGFAAGFTATLYGIKAA
jgi:hypothetical protein